MEKKNILPELQKQLLFIVEYKLVRDSEVINGKLVWSFPYSLESIHSIC
jgi:hypothetical protein